MFTPAITASSVSAPLFTISIALAQAAIPFALEMTTGLLNPASEEFADCNVVTAAADPNIHSRRLIMMSQVCTTSDPTRSDVTIRDSMTEQVSPARAVHGVVSVPGDKSISHRYAMLASIAEGDSQIYNYSTGDDCQSTLSCMEALGIPHTTGEQDGRRTLTIHGKGAAGLSAAADTLDAG